MFIVMALTELRCICVCLISCKSNSWYLQFTHNGVFIAPSVHNNIYSIINNELHKSMQNNVMPHHE